MQHTDLTTTQRVPRESGIWVGPSEGAPPPGCLGTGEDWDMHSAEGVREQIRTKAHEDNLRRGWASDFAREAFAMWMELSRAGFHPLDPEWEAGCVLETRKEEKGFSW